MVGQHKTLDIPYNQECIYRTSGQEGYSLITFQSFSMFLLQKQPMVKLIHTTLLTVQGDQLSFRFLQFLGSQWSTFYLTCQQYENMPPKGTLSEMFNIHAQICIVNIQIWMVNFLGCKGRREGAHSGLLSQPAPAHWFQ